ncbi:TIGR03084 family protein [Nocardia yunnanensis]|uniref:TIGR03084 family protein n=1 Tax=Nocardia yunnanensis TaxID=2382165 RepID=A0A386ZDZ4_9NOCA|nr:TIGR03084 family metal-binding protein [Nocardia yunnanensis]AYF75403.1 TIGR03084 family protein [Nocardia yunnanensis]
MLDYGLDMSEVKRDLAIPDLVAEGEELDALVSAHDDWSAPTAAAGWTIAHQIAHLAVADANVVLAIRSPEKFESVSNRAAAEGRQVADLDAAAGAAKPRTELLDEWRTGRAEIAAALRDIPVEQPFPWFRSDVTATLMVALRVMETWAHGQDIFDALHVSRRPTARLRSIAALGVAGLGLAFYAAQLPIPTGPFRVELDAPDGDTWTWGPEDAGQRVRGSALDFCLRVTQRRALAETGLRAVGAEARFWLENARVFL